MRKVMLALVIALAAAVPARAQTTAWADKLFGSVTVHDFGTVARGAQLKFGFKMTNIYKVPLEITNIRATCGCLTAKESARVLQPNETGFININMDGNRFSGHKTIRIYVTVGPEYVSTATLTVSANAHLDVVFNPGEIDFGLVQRGQSPTRQIDVEYAGSFPWQVTEIVKNGSATFELKVEELRNRQTQGYRLFATLKPDAPAGTFKQEVLLKTNDPSSPLLTFHVVGNIQATLTASPANVVLDGVKVGESATRRVVVRGSKPFRILGIDGQSEGITAKIPESESTTQIIEIRFEPAKAGDLKKELVIRTSLDNESTRISVEAHAAP